MLICEKKREIIKLGKGCLLKRKEKMQSKKEKAKQSKEKNKHQRKNDCIKKNGGVKKRINTTKEGTNSSIVKYSSLT